ncbi:cell envelope biogenesis protein TolA [Providencia rettgeri]|uniref:cell envelope biogenesis protein TolA n=1 Tax=Providencia rettgeri TaxID=587 RepID=UPI0018E8B64C|nr:cell envelope biogenesis protein TolA [Providencia rettgeri]QQE94422.1 cell envelope biogenesis protein TolA [Providencia rettgeri]QWJ92887.1 cell envelope biogenesis protein TolA [Providencia rettgeri]
MANELVVIEQATALDLFKAPAKAQELVNFVSGEVAKELVELEGLDLNVGVNRNKYISLAAKVTKTKTYVEGIGKEIAADLKKLPKLVDESRKLIKDQLDRLSEEVRKPATDWEIADEERKAAEELARIMPYLHAEALEMNAEHDKLIAEKEAQRIAHEEGLKKQAAEQARLAAEQKAQQEIEAAAQREREAKEAAERAEREKQEAIQRAEQATKEAQELAEREKQAAIEAERKKTHEAEQARLAEEERKRKEDAKRQEDKEHCRVFNQEALKALVSNGFDEKLATEFIKLVASNQIPHMTMNY